jgi:2,3-bisphosphoglycerate-independent phosphoglycerate mutase
LDGLADDPIPELDGRTPLEAADTPTLDKLAERGRTGLVTTVGEGIAPESDIGVFAILGYEPDEEHPGRGVIEAVGVGMDFSDGDLAYRVNFATGKWPEIEDRRVGRDLGSDEAAALAAEVEGSLSIPDTEFEFRATVEHRGVLVLHSEVGDLSAQVSNTDPAYEKRDSMGVALEEFEPMVATAVALEDTEEARRAAEVTNAFVEGSATILDSSEVNRTRRADGRLPANLILTRDGGDRVPSLEPISKRTGLDWACFVEMPVESGIAALLGMHPVAAPRLTTDAADPAAGDSYASWAELVSETLRVHRAVYVHIKGPDLPAHDGRAEDKRDVISLIDEAFFAEVTPRLARDVLIAVTADHSTSCVRKAHTADPVPLLVWGGPVTPDGSEAFGETDARSGSLGHLLGVQILPRISSLAR